MTAATHSTLLNAQRRLMTHLRFESRAKRVQIRHFTRLKIPDFLLCVCVCVCVYISDCDVRHHRKIQVADEHACKMERKHACQLRKEAVLLGLIVENFHLSSPKK